MRPGQGMGGGGLSNKSREDVDDVMVASRGG